MMIKMLTIATLRLKSEVMAMVRPNITKKNVRTTKAVSSVMM